MNAKPERQLESNCLAFARSRGWVCWKNEPTGNKGIPDDSLLSPDGATIILVEFKRPDGRGRLSQEQRRWLGRCRLAFVIDNFSDFARLLEHYERPDFLRFEEEK